MINIGPIQKALINLGKKKGFVSSEDVARFYPTNQVERQMNKLVARNIFKLPRDDGRIIIWDINE